MHLCVSKNKNTFLKLNNSHYICTLNEFYEKMKKHIRIIDLLENTKTLQEVNAKGWVRTFRNNQFIALNDG